jgi:hypothetical protein
MVALAVDRLFPTELRFPIGATGDVWNGTLSPDMRANAIGIVAFVGNDDGALLKAVERRRGAGDSMYLAGRDQEADRPALRIDPRVDLRGEASSASARTTISTLF